jgi:hypothetical protein
MEYTNTLTTITQYVIQITHYDYQPAFITDLSNKGGLAITHLWHVSMFILCYIFLTEVQVTNRPIKIQPQQFGQSGTAKNCFVSSNIHRSSKFIKSVGHAIVQQVLCSLSSQQPRNNSHMGPVLDKLTLEQVYLWVHKKQEYAFNPESVSDTWSPWYVKHSMLDNVLPTVF